MNWRIILHEFSLAQSIAEQAAEVARAEGVSRVDIVRLRIGQLSGVSEEALQSCWQITSGDSLLGQSRLVIENVPVTFYCGNCQSVVTPSDAWILECPACGSSNNDLRSGKELELVALECT